MDDIDKAEYIWENISYSKVMDVEDDVIENVMKMDSVSYTHLDVYKRQR